LRLKRLKQIPINESKLEECREIGNIEAEIGKVNMEEYIKQKLKIVQEQ